MNIHPFFAGVYLKPQDVAYSLQKLYNDYVAEIEYFIDNGFQTDPILAPESWFESILNGTL